MDLRELFASRDIDAVTIATPNHWHSLAGVWACQAGKDVYVEKPISHNVWEGRQLAAAAKKYQRVVQAGMQIRSGEGMTEAVEWIRAGNLGKIVASRGFCYKRRDSIGKTTGPQPVPASINYDLWTGPAPLLPPRRNSQRNGPVHYDWHWIWNYGNGDVGNQGIHQMDVARWFLGEPGLPRHTFSIGGRLGYDDDGETPNTQVIVHDYATAPLIFEVRGLPSKPGKNEANTAGLSSADAADAAAATMDKYHGVSIGNVIDCEGGRLVIPNYLTAIAHDRDGKVIKEFKGRDRHMQNFIDVIRSRKTADLYGPIDEGHVSSALCHLGNISHQVGRTMSAGELAEKTKGDSVTAEATGRMVEHLQGSRRRFHEDAADARRGAHAESWQRGIHRRIFACGKQAVDPRLSQTVCGSEAGLNPSDGEGTATKRHNKAQKLFVNFRAFLWQRFRWVYSTVTPCGALPSVERLCRQSANASNPVPLMTITSATLNMPV